jgi:hypothetical protein
MIKSLLAAQIKCKKRAKTSRALESNLRKKWRWNEKIATKKRNARRCVDGAGSMLYDK